MKKTENTGYYKTEEQLKEEARQRAAQQARIQAAKPPPSPKKKKADNFWYHYKWHTIGGIFALVLIVFFAKDVLFRTNPDATIILATASPLPAETAESLQTALEEVAWDFNGDGKVSIAVDSIYMPTGSMEEPPESIVSADTASVDTPPSDDTPEMNMNAQQDYASVMKLTTVIAAGMDPVYLLDDALYEYMVQMGAGTTVDEQGETTRNTPTEEDIYKIFERLDVAGGQVRIPVAATSLADNPALAPLADMAFSLRLAAAGKVDGDYHSYCQALLETLMVAQAG